MRRDQTVEPPLTLGWMERRSSWPNVELGSRYSYGGTMNILVIPSNLNFKSPFGDHFNCEYSYLSEAACMTRKLLDGKRSESFVIFKMSSSHSSSIQCGDSNNSAMSISCTSRGVAKEIRPGLTLFKQKADIDSWSLWMTRTGSVFDELLLLPCPSTTIHGKKKNKQ